MRRPRQKVNTSRSSEEWKSWLNVIKNNFVKTQSDSIFVSRPGDERPYLKINIFGKLFLGLLDTGASRSIIGGQCWDELKQLGIKLSEADIVNCSVADGSKCECIGTIELPVILDNQLRLIKFLVVPSIRHKVILGIDFWKQMGILPNLKIGKWEFLKSDCIAEISIDDKRLSPRENLTSEQAERLNKLVEAKFKELPTEFKATNLVQCELKTNASPIKQRYYPVSPVVQKTLSAELDKMLELDIVEPSDSPWSSPILLVKKPDNSYRFVVDFRRVNAVCSKDAYPLPYVTSILDKLRNARFLSSIDLKMAYWQVPVAENSKNITAFTVPGRGLFHFNRMPFGLQTAPAVWQRFMDRLFGEAFEPFVFVYLDDIIVISETFEQHLEILSKVFDRLIEAGLTINRDKCKFCLPELKYLGFVVNQSGLFVDPDKVKAITEIPAPKNTRQVRRFVGMASWYRRFIPNFSTITAPITSLLKKNKKFVWNDECQNSFQKIKDCLISPPILTCPDFNLPFCVQTDASAYGLGAVLTQKDSEGHERVICYASRTLTRQERNYTTTERECLGVIYAIEKFRCYLEGIKFTVITDHASLLWLNNLKDPIGRLARWALRLQQFEFDIIHRKGKENVVPDLLSRAVSAEIDLIEVDKTTDPWYLKLIDDVRKNPHFYPKFRLEGNQIYWKTTRTRDCPDEVWKLVVPKEYRRQVFDECHDQPTAGHFGVFKTLDRISRLYYWPKMQVDVTRYVKNCTVCQKHKPVHKAPLGLMGRWPQICRPWQLLSCDLMEFPRSSNGYTELLVVTDYFSKYVLTFPLRNSTGAKIVKHLENDVFLKFSVPQYLICDNGTQFTSRVFKTLAERYKYRICYNAKYHPQNNPIERTNGTLKTLIRTYLGTDHRKWDENLVKLSFAINTSRHEVTKYSPHFLNYFREHILSGLEYEPLPINDDLPEINRTLEPSHVQELHGFVAKIQKRLGAAYEKNKKTYDKRRREADFRVGQKVLRRNYVLSRGADFFAAKLAPRFIGPFIIHKRVGYCTYLLASPEGKILDVWHAKDLKPFQEE